MKPFRPPAGNLNLVSLILAALTAVAAILVWSGGLSGSRGGFAVFVLITALLLAVAWRLVLTFGDDAPWDIQAIDVLTVALVIIVALGLVLGTLGLLWLPVVMLVLAGIGACPHPRPLSCGERGEKPELPLSPQERGLGGEGLWSLDTIRWPHAILAGLVTFGIAQLARDRGLLPPVGDAIGYHLPFVAEWVQSGRLVMPAPAAGDPSPPFYPLNSSLWMFWTVAPFESDVVARFVQLPFFLLLFLAVVRLGLEINLPPAGALAAGLLTLSLPDVIRSLALAENDVILAGLLLAATANMALLWRKPTVWRAAMGATLLGLAIGTKVLAVPFVAVLGIGWLAIVVYRWRGEGWKRVIMLAAMAALIVILLGGYSYIRNAVVMTNPSYPVEVQLGGEELLPGLYAATQEWKESHPFYPFDWPGFFGFGMRGLFGWTVPLLILPGLALAVVRAPRERELKTVVLALWCALSLAIFWFVIPYHFARFLYPMMAWGIIAALWGWLLLFKSRVEWLAIMVIPVALLNVSSMPIGTGVWRSQTYLFGAALIVGGTALMVLLFRNVAGRLSAQTLGLAMGALLLLLIAVWPMYGERYEAQRFDQWGRLTGFLQSQPQAWRWLWETTGDEPATIAVAGTNSTFPLYGPSLQNRVLTISRDGQLQGYDWGIPFKPFGEPDRAAWLETITASDVDYLWITPNVSFGDWPVEDAWAAASDRFEPILIEDDLHVWRVTGQ